MYVLDTTEFAGGGVASFSISSCTLKGTPLWPTCARQWLAVCALAAGPQLTGHIGFNFALHHLPAWTVPWQAQLPMLYESKRPCKDAWTDGGRIAASVEGILRF